MTAILQRHYTCKEIAEQWNGISVSTVFRLFKDEPGVVRIGNTEAPHGQRVKISIRIPEDVVERVYEKMTRPAWNKTEGK